MFRKDLPEMYVTFPPLAPMHGVRASVPAALALVAALMAAPAAQAQTTSLRPVRNCADLQTETVKLVNGQFELAHIGTSALPPAVGEVIANIDDADNILPQVTLTTPAYALPSHCRLRGTTGPTNKIGFELRLPEYWNGRFVFQGGAGTDGLIADAYGPLGGKQASTALGRGYAVVSMNSGHKAELKFFTDSWFGTLTAFGQNPDERTDYAYRAVGTMTDAAKSLIEMYYGRQPHKSYFVGCSNGGRQGFLAATRFANKFDGVLAGAPAINIGKQLIQAAWDAQQLRKLAVQPWDAISRDDMTLVGSRIRAACDSLDGAADGMVANVPACQSKLTSMGFPASLVCPTGSNSNCLSQAKVDVLKSMMAGSRDSQGRQLYSTWPWDPGMETAGEFSSWRAWRHSYDLTFGYPIMTMLGGGFLNFIANNAPNVNALQPDGSVPDAWNYLLGYNFDEVLGSTGNNGRMSSTLYPYTETSNAQLNVPDPTNLSAFKAKKGRLIVYTGSADPTVSVNDITNWYNGLRARDPAHAEYVRLYVVPGMNHCSGGPATDEFDLFTPLEKWTSDLQDPITASQAVAVAPQRVVAQVRSNNSAVPSSWSSSRKRPLCEFPKTAVFNGKKNSLGGPDYVSEAAYDCK